jgi:tetratricopeptide (TPR) repeat protein
MQYEQAKKYYEEIFAKHIKIYIRGSINRNIANLLLNLAYVYSELGDYRKQKELLEEALKFQIKYYGTRDHIDIAVTQINLAVAYGCLGDPNKQKELLEEVLKFQIKYYGTRDHIMVAKTIHNIAEANFRIRNPDDGISLLEEALIIKLKYYKTKEHLSVAITIAYLAQGYAMINNFTQALELISIASKVLLEYGGKDHSYTKSTLIIRQHITDAYNSYLRNKIESQSTNVVVRINSRFYRRGMFFSPSKYAMEQQPYGPYADVWCHPRSLDVLEGLEHTRLAKRRDIKLG